MNEVVVVVVVKAIQYNLVFDIYPAVGWIWYKVSLLGAMHKSRFMSSCHKKCLIRPAFPILRAVQLSVW